MSWNTNRICMHTTVNCTSETTRCKPIRSICNHAVNNGPLSIPFKPPGFRHDVLLNAGQEARMPAL